MVVLCKNLIYHTLNRFNGRITYQMTFDYTFEYDEDKIWFAYAIPYTFTMLNNFLKAVEDI